MWAERRCRCSISLTSPPRREWPRSRSRVAIATAEFDPHAFLYWPAMKLVVVPLQTYAVGGPTIPGGGIQSNPPGPQSGALVLRIDDTGISEVGFLTQPTGFAGRVRQRRDRAIPGRRSDAMDRVERRCHGHRADQSPAVRLDPVRVTRLRPTCWLSVRALSWLPCESRSNGGE